jgi:hypothetical protein
MLRIVENVRMPLCSNILSFNERLFTILEYCIAYQAVAEVEYATVVMLRQLLPSFHPNCHNQVINCLLISYGLFN